MTIDRDAHIDDPRRLLLLWTGLLLPPVAVLLDINVGYFLVTQACLHRNIVPLHLVHLGAMLLAMLGGLAAWRLWQNVGRGMPHDEPGPPGTTRFMAATGLAGGVLFTLVTLAQWIPVFVLSPCQ
jgi:hypothetical protein